MEPGVSFAQFSAVRRRQRSSQGDATPKAAKADTQTDTPKPTETPVVREVTPPPSPKPADTPASKKPDVVNTPPPAATTSEAAPPSASPAMPPMAPLAPAVAALAGADGGDDVVVERTNMFLTEWWRSFMLVLILHDIVASVYVTVYGRAASAAPAEGEFHVLWATNSLFSITTTVTLAISAIEGLVRLVIVRKAPLTMPRVFDTLLVGAVLYFGLWKGQRAFRFLLLLRLWRFWEHLQLVKAALQGEVLEAQGLHAVAVQRCAALEKQVDQVKSQWRWEAEARQRAEDQIAQYKAENATLVEMLNIAAQESVLRNGGEEDYADYEGEDMAAEGEGAAGDGQPWEEFEEEASFAPTSRVVIAHDGSYLKLGEPSS